MRQNVTRASLINRQKIDIKNFFGRKFILQKHFLQEILSKFQPAEKKFAKIRPGNKTNNANLLLATCNVLVVSKVQVTE